MTAAPRWETRLIDLGAVPRATPLPSSTWSALDLDPAELPEPLRRLLDRFAGTSFALGAASSDDPARRLGWLLDPDELVEAWDDTRDCLPAMLLPIENDGGDNHLCVDLHTGAVVDHVHDAPRHRHVLPVSGSLTDFLLSLGPTDEDATR